MPFKVPALVGHLPVKEGGENKANKTIKKKKKKETEKETKEHNAFVYTMPLPRRISLTLK